MRFPCHILIALTAFCVGSSPVDAQIADTVARVVASGSVTVRLVPTKAIIYLLIEATASTASEAVGRGSESSSGVLDTLRKAGGAEDIKLVQYGVSPTANWGGSGGQPNTFTSRAAVRFVTSLGNVQALTAAAYARGASASAAPVFQSDSLDTVLTRAVEEATVMARQRAEALARGLGGRLGAMTHISTQPMYGPDYGAALVFPTPHYDPQSRPLPEIRHTVNVNTTWKLASR